LETLILRDNDLQLEGIRHICNCLVVNKSLKCLDLHNTGVGDEGGSLLLWALDWNNTIDKIILTGEGAPNETLVQHIKSELKQRSNKPESITKKALKEDINPVIDLILMNNLYSNPRFQHMVPNEEKRENVTRSLTRAVVKWAQKKGTVFIRIEKRENLPERIIGCTVWIPPNEVLKAPVSTFIKEAGKTLIKVGLKSMGRVKSVVSQIEEFTKEVSPKECWKLMYLEVHELLSQINEVWDSVIQDVLKIADESKMPVFTYVTKESSIATLIRYGFAVIAERLIDNKINLWGLVREPK